MFLAQTGARTIVVCGVGGAYPASGLEVGDVVCAASECYGDLGATSPSGFLDMKALGFPVVEARLLCSMKCRCRCSLSSAACRS